MPKSKLDLGRRGLSVLPLGVGDAFSVVHHPTSLLLSRYQNPAWDDDMILIDCPQSIRRMMHEADDGRYHGLDLHRVGTLVLTHLHADHASGLETLAAFFKIVVGRRPRLVALPEVIAGVPRFLEAIESLGGMEDLFDVTPFPGDAAAGTGGVSLGEGPDHFLIEARRTMHPVPTSALRILHGGRRLSYSSDTSFDPGLWRWLWEKDPDLVVHEVGHGIHASLDDVKAALDSPDDEVMRRYIKFRFVHYPDDMIPMLGDDLVLREGKLEIV